MEAASGDTLPHEAADLSKLSINDKTDTPGTSEGASAPLVPSKDMAEKLFSDDPKIQLEAATAFRRILSGNDPFVDQVVELGVTPRFAELLEKDDPLLQSEVAWALTNIATCESRHVRALISADVVPKLVKLLSSGTLNVREQAAWALGNIAGDSSFHRDVVLRAGILQPLLSILSNDLRLSTLKTSTWTLSNLCRGRDPPPNWDAVSPAIPMLINLLKSSDEEMLIDTLWIISYLTEQQIQPIIDIGLCPVLVSFLQHTSRQILTPALRAVGNIARGTRSQCQAIVNCGVLPALLPLLSGINAIKKEACWTISNILADPTHTNQLQEVIDAGLVAPLIQLHESCDFKTRKEACWALANATVAALLDTAQMRYMVEQGCIRFFCDMLKMTDEKVLSLVLDGLINILKAGEMDGALKGVANPYPIYVELEGGLNTVHAMRYHSHSGIREKVASVMDGYFSVADGMD